MQIVFDPVLSGAVLVLACVAYRLAQMLSKVKTQELPARSIVGPLAATTDRPRRNSIVTHLPLAQHCDGSNGERDA